MPRAKAAKSFHERLIRLIAYESNYDDALPSCPVPSAPAMLHGQLAAIMPTVRTDCTGIRTTSPSRHERPVQRSAPCNTPIHVQNPRMSSNPLAYSVPVRFGIERQTYECCQ